MRNAVKLGDLLVTIDNSGCIGEKPADLVHTTNEITAYFTARTAILEQWCAGAVPIQLLLANFTSDAAWADYVRGIGRVFNEVEQSMPPLTGSTESNFESMQSGVALTMIGQSTFMPNKEGCRFFAIGLPLVGEQVLQNPQHVASLGQLYALLQTNIIQAIWPTGSKGVGVEIKRFVGTGYTCALDLVSTAGPSTTVLIAIQEKDVELLYKQITAPIHEITTE